MLLKILEIDSDMANPNKKFRALGNMFRTSKRRFSSRNVGKVSRNILINI